MMCAVCLLFCAVGSIVQEQQRRITGADGILRVTGRRERLISRNIPPAPSIRSGPDRRLGRRVLF